MFQVREPRFSYVLDVYNIYGRIILHILIKQHNKMSRFLETDRYKIQRKTPKVLQNLYSEY